MVTTPLCDGFCPHQLLAQKLEETRKLILTNSEQWVLGWGTTGLLRDVGPWWGMSITAKATKWKRLHQKNEGGCCGVVLEVHPRQKF